MSASILGFAGSLRRGSCNRAIGMWGTVRAQSRLRQVFVFINVLPVNQPQVLVAWARRLRGEGG